MINDSDIKKFPAHVVREKLKDQFGKQFKKYYMGDRLEIPTFNLPCMIIEKEIARPELGATSMDDVTHTIRIKVVMNKRRELNFKDDELLWRYELEKLIESRDKTTGNYHDETICGVLRKQITLGDRFYNSEMEIRYGIVPRPNEVTTEEGHVILTLKESVLITDRT